MQWEYACLVQVIDVPVHTTIGETETFTLHDPTGRTTINANGAGAIELLNWLAREDRWELVTVETKFPQGMTRGASQSDTTG